LPDLAGPASKAAYYKTHCIQKASGDEVTVNGMVYDAKDPANGLGFVDPLDRTVDYVPAPPVSAMTSKAWLITPAATLVGGAVGAFFGLLSSVNFSEEAGRSDSSQQQQFDTFTAVGAGLGLALGATASTILTCKIPGMAARKTQRNAVRYNQRLWKALNFDLEPYGRRGGAVRMNMGF